MKTTPLVKSILIDPFKMELYPIQFSPGQPQDYLALLDASAIQGVRLEIISANGTEHVAWVDSQGLDRQPFSYPHWTIKAFNDRGVAGYGLVTGINESPGLFSQLGNQANMCDCQIPLDALAHVIGWEPWGRRISIDNVIPQMMRIYQIGWA
jgi:hypothetical protein